MDKLQLNDKGDMLPTIMRGQFAKVKTQAMRHWLC